MPFIQVKVIENVFSDEQKQQIVRELTDAMVHIEGENMRPSSDVVRGRGGQERQLGDRREPAVHRGREGAGRRSWRLRSSANRVGPATGSYGPVLPARGDAERGGATYWLR